MKGSPLEGTAELFVKYGEKYKVDPLLAIAIQYHESHHCKDYANWHNEKYRNCSGIMQNSKINKLATYETWDAFINDFVGLLGRYIHDYGRNTIKEIGDRYCPPDAHYLNRSWNGGVTKKYHSLWKELEK